MPYDYKELRAQVFTEEGSVMLIRMRDRIRRLVAQTGAITMGAAVREQTGDSWLMLACVDRLAEMGELREVGASEALRGQDRVFIPGPEWP